MRELERFVILQIVDTRWREHLESMDYLREGVHLRAMAQKDPLVEYRGEGHAMFEELGRGDPRGGRAARSSTRRSRRRRGRRAPAGAAQRRATATSRTRTRQLRARDAIAAAGAEPTAGATRAAARRRIDVDRDAADRSSRPTAEKIGRNDPCWCGGGKKFKKLPRRRDSRASRQVWRGNLRFRASAPERTPSRARPPGVLADAL